MCDVEVKACAKCSTMLPDDSEEHDCTPERSASPVSPCYSPTSPAFNEHEMRIVFPPSQERKSFGEGIRPLTRSYVTKQQHEAAYALLLRNYGSSALMQAKAPRERVLVFIGRCFPIRVPITNKCEAHRYRSEPANEYDFCTDWKELQQPSMGDELPGQCFMFFCAWLVCRRIIPAFFIRKERRWDEEGLRDFLRSAPGCLAFAVASHLGILVEAPAPRLERSKSF